jgi:hypothetical protein
MAVGVSLRSREQFAANQLRSGRYAHRQMSIQPPTEQIRPDTPARTGQGSASIIPYLNDRIPLEPAMLGDASTDPEPPQDGQPADPPTDAPAGGN